MDGTLRRAPRLEALEERLVLSATPHHHLAVRPTVHVQSLNVPTLSGTFKAEFTSAPGGMTVAVTGSGNVKPLGAVTVTGTLSVKPMYESGPVTLTNGTDSLVLNLKLLTMDNMGAPPFSFTVIGGTGIEAGATGHGLGQWIATATATRILPFLLRGTVTPG